MKQTHLTKCFSNVINFCTQRKLTQENKNKQALATKLMHPKEKRKERMQGSAAGKSLDRGSSVVESPRPIVFTVFPNF